jgi:hypothetical protein
MGLFIRQKIAGVIKNGKTQNIQEKELFTADI